MGEYQVGLNVNLHNLLGEPNNRYVDASYHYCFSLRNVEYLDAGVLPLLSPELRMGTWMLGRKKVALVASEAFLSDPRAVLDEPLRDASLWQRLESARRELSIYRHIDRLIRFYESL